MSTGRAIATGILVAIASFVLLVVVPDRLLKLSGPDRSTKVLLATAEFTVALVGLLWGMRRLQSRNVL